MKIKAKMQLCVELEKSYIFVAVLNFDEGRENPFPLSFPPNTFFYSLIVVNSVILTLT